MRLQAGALVVGLLACLSWTAHGQDPARPATQTPPASQQTPRFRAGVELTQIDVTILDANRRPFHGLKLEDFELFEDGVPKTIEAFTEVVVPDAEDGASWRRDVAPDVRSNSAEDGRVIVFLLDEAMTQAYDSDVLIPTVKRITKEVIDQLGPNDVAAVLFTWDNKRQAQDFTTDRALLKAAVEKFQPRQFQFQSGVVYDWSRNSSGVTGSVLKYLTDSPGRRKAMIFVTPTMLMRPQWPWARDHPSVEDLYLLNAFETALKAGVTVYGISPTGLRSLAKGDSPDAGARDGAAGRPVTLGAPSRSLAAETGGFMINSPAQFKEGVAQILRETGSYYLLGYKAATDFKTKGDSPTPGYRTLEVRVKREGLTVKGRSGFIPKKPVPSPKTPPSPLHEALAGVLPKTDLPMRVAAAPFAIPGTSDVAAIMVLAVEEPAPSERTSDHVDMRARAFTAHGDPRGTTNASLDVTLPAGRTGTVQFELLSQLPLKPGRHELRLSARSTRLERDGSVYASLDVPDFGKMPISISGILLSARPGLMAAPAGALSGIVPVVPTAQRVFGAADRVGVFLRVYQGGGKSPAPARLSVRVIDVNDRAVVSTEEALAPAQFAIARAADVRFDLPLATLPPGAYLLRVETTIGGGTARRDLRFSVRGGSQ